MNKKKQILWHQVKRPELITQRKKNIVILIRKYINSFEIRLDLFTFHEIIYSNKHFNLNKNFIFKMLKINLYKLFSVFETHCVFYNVNLLFSFKTCLIKFGYCHIYLFHISWNGTDNIFRYILLHLVNICQNLSLHWWFM